MNQKVRAKGSLSAAARSSRHGRENDHAMVDSRRRPRYDHDKMHIICPFFFLFFFFQMFIEDNTHSCAVSSLQPKNRVSKACSLRHVFVYSETIIQCAFLKRE